MKTKKRFISFLKANAVYELFMQNLTEGGHTEERFFNDASAHDLAGGAFIWDDTPQGDSFWQSFSVVWEHIVEEEGL